SMDGKTALYSFDLNKGTFDSKYELADRGVWGELLMLEDGSILLSNAFGSLDILKPGAAAVEAFVAKGTLGSPQSTTARSDRIYVADYILGVVMVDRQTRKVTPLPHPPDVCVQGIDGLYLDGQSLIAIQNGSGLARLVRMKLDTSGERITGMDILESKTPTMGSPTHGVFVGRRFYYLANTGWDRMEGSVMKPGEPPEIRLCQS